MADEFGLDAALAIEGLFKGKDDQHAAYELAHQPDAVLLPGPELRADKVNHRNVEAVELAGQTEVNLGEVDKDGHVGTTRADSALEPAELAVDAGQMEQDFGQAHDRDIFRADDALEAGGGHALAAHAVEGGGLAAGGELLSEFADQQGAVVLAAGFACRDENGRVHRWSCTLHNHSGLSGTCGTCADAAGAWGACGAAADACASKGSWLAGRARESEMPEYV